MYFVYTTHTNVLLGSCCLFQSQTSVSSRLSNLKRPKMELNFPTKGDTSTCKFCQHNDEPSSQRSDEHTRPAEVKTSVQPSQNSNKRLPAAKPQRRSSKNFISSNRKLHSPKSDTEAVIVKPKRSRSLSTASHSLSMIDKFKRGLALKQKEDILKAKPSLYSSLWRNAFENALERLKDNKVLCLIFKEFERFNNKYINTQLRVYMNLLSILEFGT